MAHEITATDNMFSVREMPWHKLGTVFENTPTRAEAQAIAHPWEPVAAPLFRRVPSIDADGNLSSTYEQVSGFVAQERSDTGDLIAATTETYTTVTNGELYDLGEALEHGDGTVTDVQWETGGSMGGGKKVWLMFRLAEPLIIKGDPHGAVIPFYLLQNNHDGMGSLRGSATQVRVVCANTQRMADLDAQARGTEFTFSHTSGITERVEEARLALAGWREGVKTYQTIAESMIQMKITKKAVTEFVERFIPAPISTMTSDRVKTNIETARGEWMGVYNSVTNEGITGTAWGLLQASSEWSEHVRRANSNESRFRRAVLDRNQIITDAKALALEAVHA